MRPKVQVPRLAHWQAEHPLQKLILSFDPPPQLPVVPVSDVLAFAAHPEQPAYWPMKAEGTREHQLSQAPVAVAPLSSASFFVERLAVAFLASIELPSMAFGRAACWSSASGFVVRWAIASRTACGSSASFLVVRLAVALLVSIEAPSTAFGSASQFPSSAVQGDACAPWRSAQRPTATTLHIIAPLGLTSRSRASGKRQWY
mmetsp:Transcript_9926/g.27017  ORF Transcript_9926/g.27017 Transcript_9926/m.27017 type:complete len:202 (+) Transcript_9926:54-659(+)|eukprot:CAMPEP_0171228074 /NCGR_PEP_ID=MMETSP0790-20130122/38175_1 /TAXON_ID=2925 /ORGANISM="Alexandrium catenella, Strain OF101" /LENGTH=201 /DNA_ID=CAMNT_0011694207 /DNA_START=28 /DNA_END=633 /DNA_ORIENTATION=+